MKLIPLLLAVLLFVGCDPTVLNSTASPVAKSAAPVPQNFVATPATLQQCPAGGMVYSLFTDTNGNGIMDGSESALTTQVVCNGSSTLLGTARISTSACAANSGVQVQSGSDLNSNGVLDPSEIQQTQILCDGANGANGSNGMNLVYQVVPALSCPDGGTTLILALDAAGLGVYSALDPGQQSMTMCNGQSTPPSKYLPVEAIEPCGETVAFKEVLLRMGDGQVLAAFSDDASGTNTRLSFLSDGTFVDTDGSGCTFSLSTDSAAQTRSLSWGGAVQEQWPLGGS